MKFKSLIKLFMTILLVTCCFGFVEVNATHNTDVTKIRLQLLEAGVGIDKVDFLVEKLENGEMLDSMKEEYSNIKPIFESFSRQSYEAKYIYPDGSVKNVSITQGIFIGSITGGVFNSGTYWYTWRNARVLASWGVVTASFYADMQGSTGFGKISAIRDWGIITAGGTFDFHDFSIIRSNASSTSPAEARLFFTATALQNFGQATFYLRLYVPYSGLPYARLAVLN